MTRDLQCRCLLCEMERRFTAQFAGHEGRESYRALAHRAPALASFRDASELVAYLHSERGGERLGKDKILAALLHVAANGNTAIAQELLLLVFVPMLHRTARQVQTRWPAVSPDDTAQHVLLSFLESAASAEFAARDSHIAFALARLLRRNAFVWGERQGRASLSHSDKEIESPNLANGPHTIERAALLNHFLEHCKRHGVLSDEDRRLLRQFKLDESPGVSRSNASRQRMKRLVAKLRRAAHKDNRELRSG